MNRRRIAMVSIVALMSAGSGLAAVPTASATPTSPSAPQSALTPNTSFTLDPSPDVRKRAVANARKALAAHRSRPTPSSAHKFTARSVVVDKNGAADVRFDRTYHGLRLRRRPRRPPEAGRLLPSAQHGRRDAGAVSTTPPVRAARAATTSAGSFEGTISTVGKPHLAV